MKGAAGVPRLGGAHVVADSNTNLPRSWNQDPGASEAWTQNDGALRPFGCAQGKLAQRAWSWRSGSLSQLAEGSKGAVAKGGIIPA